jgi:hypothetical protein
MMRQHGHEVSACTGRHVHTQKRDQRQDRDGCQVLEQKDCECQASVRTVELLVLGKKLQADRGRRQRQCESDDQRAPPAQAECHCRPAEQQARQRDLREAGAEHRPAHQPKALRRQLQSDHEQQQDHAEFGQLGSRFHVPREVQRVGADQRAGSQVTQDSAEPPTARQRHRDDRSGQIHHDILQKVRRFHALLRKVRQV